MVSESRSGGAQLIAVDFNFPIDCPVSGTIKAVNTFTGALTAATSQTVTNDGYTLEIGFNPGLPAGCYSIDLANNLCLAGDKNCLFRSLPGDTNSGGAVNLIDMAQAKAKNGAIPIDYDARFDVNLDGNINLIDMALIKSLNGLQTFDCR